MGLVTLEEETRELAGTRRACWNTKGRPCEDTVSRQPGTGLSPGAESAGPLTSEFPASRTVRSKCLGWRPPSLGHLLGQLEQTNTGG